MKLNIGPILKNEGSILNIDIETETGPLEYLGNTFVFDGPLKVTGGIRSIGGILELSGAVSGSYSTTCCSCGKAVKGRLEVPFDETVNGETEDFDSECFALNGPTLDISGLINALVWGNLPMRPLCREDCKGLCSVCGCDLNEKVCNCDRTVYDPRLAILRERH